MHFQQCIQDILGGLRKSVVVTWHVHPVFDPKLFTERDTDDFHWISFGLTFRCFQKPDTISQDRSVPPFTVVHWKKKLQKCLADKNILKYIYWEGKFLDGNELGSSHLLLSPLFTPVLFVPWGFPLFSFGLNSCPQMWPLGAFQSCYLLWFRCRQIRLTRYFNAFNLTYKLRENVKHGYSQ